MTMDISKRQFIFSLMNFCCVYLTTVTAQLEQFTFTTNQHIRADTMSNTSINRIACLRACKLDEFCFAINVEKQLGHSIDIICELQQRIPNPVTDEMGNEGSSFIRKYNKIIGLCLYNQAK